LDRKYKRRLFKWNLETTNSGLDLSIEDRIDEFFKDHYYMIGNYIRNFFSIITFVHKSQLLSKSKKVFYVAVLRDMSTIDELRFLFYATIWKNKEEITWIKMLDKYKISEFMGNHKKDLKLIIPDDDWKAFENISKKNKKRV
jgi:Putative phage abortive infection protein